MISEIYSNDISEITVYTSIRGERVQPDVLPVAKIHKSSSKTDFTGEGEDLAVSAVAGSTGVFKVLVTPSKVAGSRYARITTSYTLPGVGLVENKDVFEVKTRLVEYDDFNSTLGRDVTGMERKISFEDFTISEQRARLIIQSFCNQNFNYWIGLRQVVGHPNHIILPQHVEKVNGIYTVDENSFFSISNSYRILDGGFSLEKIEKQEPRKTETVYQIDAVWGYEYIPDSVRMAAIELTRDFASGAADMRRQYLLSSDSQGNSSFSQTQDAIYWRAYSDSTGNAIVDNLLAEHRVYYPGVI